MKIKMMIPKGQEKEFQENLNDLFEGVNGDKDFEKRLDHFEDMHTPKYELYQKCREDFRGVFDAFIAETLTRDRALLLLKSKYHRLLEEIKELDHRGKLIIVDDVPEEFIEISLGITAYYKEMKNNIEYYAEQNTQTPQEDKTAPSESGAAVPLVIHAVLKEGLLNDVPVNGKYTKRAGKKDMDIIKWIFDYSGYGDSLTADLYMQYIQVSVSPQTIGQYISRSKTEAK